jgi:hypothetical protein
MLYGIWLALLGVLGAANLIIARRPDAAEAIAKIAPYQGWIGAISAIWGLWGVIHAILSLAVLGHYPILWATWLAVGAVQLCLGLLLGIGVIKSFVKAPDAVARMDQMVARLAPKQGLLGLVAIGLGLWMIVAGVLWSVA